MLRRIEMAPRGPGWPLVAVAGGPRCGCVGRRAAAAGGRVPTLAVRGARARAAVWCGVPGLRRMCLCEAGGGGRRALVRTGGPSGGGCWRPSASAGGARGACARPRGAVGRVCAGLAELVGALGCACAWVCGRGPRVFAACACTGVPMPCVGVPMPCVLEATRMRVVRVGVYVACSYGTCARRYVLCHWMRTSARCRHRAM